MVNMRSLIRIVLKQDRDFKVQMLTDMNQPLKHYRNWFRGTEVYP